MTLLYILLFMILAVLGESAKAPPNDKFVGAVQVYSGDTKVLDTTKATTDDDDTHLHQLSQDQSDCYFSATDASVWYKYSAVKDTMLVVEVSESDYFVRVLVGSATQGSGDLDYVDCSDTYNFAFFAEAGKTYYILAFDSQEDGDGKAGGTLKISFTEIEPAVLKLFAVDKKGTFNSKGAATISGTYACTGASFIGIDVFADQNTGRFTISGYKSFESHEDPCDGNEHAWSVQVSTYDEGKKFTGGKTVVGTYTYGSDEQYYTSFNSGLVEHMVKLTRGSKL